MTRCFTPRACAGRHARLRCRHHFCRGSPIWQLSVNSSKKILLPVLESRRGHMRLGTCKQSEKSTEKGSCRGERQRKARESVRIQVFLKKNIFCGCAVIPSWPTAIFELLADGADSLGESDLDRQTVETPSRDRYADATRFHDSLVRESGRRGDNFRPRTPIRRSRTRGWRCIAIGRTWRCS